jgi:cytochrome c oxidase assembly protein subunit 15
VRLTDAGLGCPDWPGCYGHLYPQTASAEPHSGVHFAKALHEMIHRYFASTLGLIIAALLIWAIRFRADRGQPLIPVALLFVIVCLQGALGALTVTLLLKPLIVTAHLLGGLTTLGILWWLSLAPGEMGGVRADRPAAGREPFAQREPVADREAGLRRFALVGLAALAVQIFLGGWTSTNYAAVACPDLPACQHSWWPAMDFHNAFVLWRGLGIDYEGGVLANPARVAIHFTHRLGAVASGSILIALGILTAARARNSRLARAGRLLVLAVVVQISIGAATIHWGVPLPLATLHNAGAAFLVLCMVTLLRALWPQAGRPLQSP